MARRQFTSKARVGRNLPPFLVGKGITEVRNRPRLAEKFKSPVSVEALADQGRTSRVLEGVLEDERARLADALSVLGCLHVALLYAGNGGFKEDPNYAKAAAIAMALVREATDRLDSACLRPVVEAFGSAESSAGKHIRQRR